MKNLTKHFLRESQGVTAIEYGLIAGLIAVVIAGAVGDIGTQLNTLFTSVVTAITPTPAGG
ncbi:MAG TPA: Flp family type IVb pilin [Paraburkholderia sp.]